MDIFEFGDAKLRLGDIDPLYRAVHRVGWSADKVCRFTLAFVSFDLAGLACEIIDEGGRDKFWSTMHAAVAQTKRGAPRRYFRGEVAHVALHTLEARYGTAQATLRALEGSFAHAEGVMASWPQYGPTAIFKLCDMAERVCGVHVDFSDVTPSQLMSNSMVTKGVHKAMEQSGFDTPAELFDAMKKYKWATKAGPSFDRKLNMQEFETILCYFSHDDKTNKHLPGMDIENIRAELKGWGPTARKLETLL